MFHGKLSKRIGGGLKVLRARIDRAGVPSSCLDETLTIATWNIRELGRRRRSRAALHYVAEIIGQFDLVSPCTGHGSVLRVLRMPLHFVEHPLRSFSGYRLLFALRRRPTPASLALRVPGTRRRCCFATSGSRS